MVSICPLKQHTLCAQQQILKHVNIASADLKQWREMEQCHPGKTLQTRGPLGTELRLDQEKISHPISTSTHINSMILSLLRPAVLSNINLRGQTMDAISCLEDGPGITRDGPRGDMAGHQPHHCKVTPHEGTAIPRHCIYFLASPLPVFCQIKKLNW